MPLLTLQASTTYNLKKILTGETAGIASHTDEATFKSGLVAKLLLRNPSGSPGTVYLARNYANIATTRYDIALPAGASISEETISDGNNLNLAEFSVVVSNNNTLLEVYALPY